jgi:hypothetical protein
MALGSNHQTITTAANFIPEQWSDETVAAYKSQLVLANLVTKMNWKGKKGDTVHIPVPARGDASVKAASTQVTLVTDTAGVINVLIDKHYEYSHLFEDIAEMQSLPSMRRFYTDAAGYGLAKRVDRELHKIGASFNGGTIATATALYEKAVIGSDGSTNFSGSANTNTGNGATLTDAAIRKMIQTLEDQDVNSAELNWALPPVEINRLRGLARFTEQAFVGNGSAITTGKVGDLYGTMVYSSTQCPFIHVNSVTGTQSVNFSSTTLTTSYVDDFGITVDWATSTPTDTKYRAGLLFHKDAMVHIEQQGIRMQSQYKQEYLGTLVTADTVFGTSEMRDYAGLAVAVPA